MVRQGGLGRGLASLIPQRKKQKTKEETANYFGVDDDDFEKIKKQENSLILRKENLPAKISDVSVGSLLELPVDKIVPNPFQPRKYFDEKKLNELAKSIKEHGIIQPLAVSVNDEGQYELIAGERRLSASKLIGLEKVPVIVRKPSNQEKLELALIENVQRHNLNVIEEARAYRQLQDEFDLTQEETAEKVGKSRSAVANITRLLSLPIEIQRALMDEKISEGHARTILAISNPEKQRGFFEMILRENLTVRQAENKIKEISVSGHRRKITQKDQTTGLQEEELAEKFGTKVSIRKNKKGGQIVIDFYSDEEFGAIFEKLRN